MSDRLTEVLDDLDAEGAQLESWVAPLVDEAWGTQTPAPGWTIAHQIAHLHWTDDASLIAIHGGDEWSAFLKAAVSDPDGFVNEGADRLLGLERPELFARWCTGRGKLREALQGAPAGEKIAWFGPPMSPASMATARLMETWAHSHDVAAALGIDVPVSARVRHVCHLGVRTRGFAYLVHDKQKPDAEVYVELTGPDGETWTWGSEDAADRVTGNAWDFALLATRRRHRDDVDVCAEGPAADEWLSIIQAFAGPPGPDPARGRA